MALSEKCFFQPSTNTVIDLVRANGLSMYGERTLAQLQEEEGSDVMVMDMEAAIQQINASHTKPPFEISEDRFDDMLGILPPQKWVRYKTEESFHVSERITGNIVMIFVRIGGRYFEMHDEATLTHEDRVKAAGITLLIQDRLRAEAH